MLTVTSTVGEAEPTRSSSFDQAVRDERAGRGDRASGITRLVGERLGARRASGREGLPPRRHGPGGHFPRTRDWRRPEGLPVRPAARNRQSDASGHASHRGAGRHDRRPRSISAWFHSPGADGSSHGFASAASRSANTSSGSAPWMAPSADPPDVGVDGRHRLPVPDRRHGGGRVLPYAGEPAKRLASRGTLPSWSRTTARALSWRATARRLYPSPAHARMTSAREASASAPTSGNLAMNAPKIGSTLAAWVCWSITSETSVR